MEKVIAVTDWSAHIQVNGVLKKNVPFEKLSTDALNQAEEILNSMLDDELKRQAAVREIGNGK